MIASVRTRRKNLTLEQTLKKLEESKKRLK
jgi:hypothetical protein